MHRRIKIKFLLQCFDEQILQHRVEACDLGSLFFPFFFKATAPLYRCTHGYTKWTNRIRLLFKTKSIRQKHLHLRKCFKHRISTHYFIPIIISTIAFNMAIHMNIIIPTIIIIIIIIILIIDIIISFVIRSSTNNILLLTLLSCELHPYGRCFVAATPDALHVAIDASIECSTSKELIHVTNHLSGKCGNVLPYNIPVNELPQTFGNFFNDKISQIRQGIDNTSLSPLSSTEFQGECLSDLRCVTEEEVRFIIISSPPKSRCLDPIPTPLLMKHLDSTVGTI